MNIENKYELEDKLVCNNRSINLRYGLFNTTDSFTNYICKNYLIEVDPTVNFKPLINDKLKTYWKKLNDNRD